MPSSYTCFHYHAIFGTKNRMPQITPPLRDHPYSYIGGHEEHHRRLSFQEEFIVFLDRHGISYDERYRWT